jgi:iron complex outermembrane receptor protein
MLTAVGEVGLSSGYYHNSGFAWDPDNRVRQGAYGMLTVSVDWISPGERMAVRAAGSNLNRAEVCMYASGTALGDICSPRAPRAVSVDVSLRF